VDFAQKDWKDDTNLTAEQHDLIQRSLEATYGKGATLGDDGEVTYMEGKEKKTVTLTNEEIRNMIATQYATE
jgi:hypothetical protein